MFPYRILVVVIGVLLILPACSSMEGTTIHGEFPGLNDAFDSSNRVDLVLVHGMGGYFPPDPEALVGGITQSLGLQPVGVEDHDDYEDDSRYYGRLKKLTFQSEDGRRELVVWIHYWTGVTTPVKAAYLAFDTLPEQTRGRLGVNADLKARVINKNMADAVLYLGPHSKALKHGLVETLVKMMEEPVSEENRRFAFVTFSLGSRLLLDTLAELDASADPARRGVAERIAERFGGCFMLANQIALLEMQQFSYSRNMSADGENIVYEPTPQLKGVDELFRRKEDSTGGARRPIVAINDPNDLLTYAIPDYIHGKMPGRFVNVSTHVARTDYWIPFIGNVASPDEAHNGYGKDPDVVGMIVHGSSWKPNRRATASGHQR